MKKLICFVALAFMMTININAQRKMAALFKEMPDSILSVLTKNNRLDMIDFMDAKMKAQVTNLLDGKSEMTMLADDSLKIKMSDVMSVKMMVVDAKEEYDSCKQVVCMISTYTIPSTGDYESIVNYYSVKWHPLENPNLLVPLAPVSTSFKNDEKVMSTKPVY